MPSDATCKRCPVCLTNWPNDVAYQDCPECGTRTSYMYQARPIPTEEAERRTKTAEFQEWLVMNGRE